MYDSYKSTDDNNSSDTINTTSTTNTANTTNNSSNTNENLAPVDGQGKELPGGTYIIGEDLPAGKYNLT